MSFEDNNRTCVLLEQSQSLRDLIEIYRSTGRYFPENDIKETISVLAEYLLERNVSPQTKLSSRCIHYSPQGKVYIDLTEDQNEQDIEVVQIEAGSAAIYEAPEVIERNNPDTRAFVWTIGCIIYEMLTLEAAFYDRSGVNPFQVYMDITQGVMPSEPSRGSQDMKYLLWDCLKLDPSERASFSRINPKLNDSG